jgi:hypothetical protein
MDWENPTKAPFSTGDVIRPKGNIFATGSIIQEAWYDGAWKVKTRKYGVGLASKFKLKTKSR